jgi:hypothetical protein
VTVEGIRPALALFPATKKAPDLDGIDLAAYVAPRFAEDAARATATPWRSWVAAVAAALVLLLGLGGWVARPRMA